MSLHSFNRATLPASPWKNGGGVTREIACWPPGAGMDDFLWRLSIATVAASGPFSAFPGIDRVITLLDGPGVRLTSNDGAIDHRLDTPLAPFAFSGEAVITGTVLGESCSDFNVMTRRAALKAHVEVLHDAVSTRQAPHGLLLAVAGSWRLRDENPCGVGLRNGKIDKGPIDDERHHDESYVAIIGNGAEPLLMPSQGIWWANEPHAWRLTPDAPASSLLAVRILPLSVA